MIGKKYITVGSKNLIYRTQADLVLTTAFQMIDLNIDANNFRIVNKAATQINFSFDGTTNKGDLEAGEWTSFAGLRSPVIWLKGAVGGEAYKLWAW